MKDYVQSLILAALGGALGSAARFQLAGWMHRASTAWRLPLGTLAVNVIGCLLIGILAGLGEKHDLFSTKVRIFLFTGILGGFTTFSAFGLETFSLLRRGEMFVAGCYVLLSVAMGLLFVWLGFALVQER